MARGPKNGCTGETGNYALASSLHCAGSISTQVYILEVMLKAFNTITSLYFCIKPTRNKLRSHSHRSPNCLHAR